MKVNARTAFLRACALDVLVRKPGNVSLMSPGHGMQAAQFIASAQAAAGPLFESGARVGTRIERAVAASWAAAGCNTNLGIVLLCAPLAVAAERAEAPTLRDALAQVLDEMNLDDSRAAYRAIAQARPAGLGRAIAEDVHAPPTLALRAAMALAAERDSIARQYAEAYADLFDVALPLLAEHGFSIASDTFDTPPDARTDHAVRSLYLALLARWPDSHIVRKHGAALAHSVMTAAQAASPADDSGWAAWDQSLKDARINPGTTADLTVAALFLAALA